MHYTKNSIINYQTGVELLFRNSIHQPGIKETVMKYGYDEAQLTHIYKRNDELTRLVSSIEQAKYQKTLLFGKKNELLRQIKKDYMRYLKLARIVLVNDVKAEEALMLNGARQRTIKELVFQISIFVSNLLNNVEWLKALSIYNITEANIKQLNEQLKELSRLTERSLEAQGEVRRLTTLKKKMLVEIQSYVSDYVKVVRIALEEKPKLLQSLGIKVKGDY